MINSGGYGGFTLLSTVKSHRLILAYSGMLSTHTRLDAGQIIGKLRFASDG